MQSARISLKSCLDCNAYFYVHSEYSLVVKMKKVNKQCLLDTPRTVRVSEKTWQVIVQTSKTLVSTLYRQSIRLLHQKP